jgi:hypothetical protein
MHLRLALNLMHLLQDLGALYALRRTPNFYEIHPRTIIGSPNIQYPDKNKMATKMFDNQTLIIKPFS